MSSILMTEHDYWSHLQHYRGTAAAVFCVSSEKLARAELRENQTKTLSKRGKNSLNTHHIRQAQTCLWFTHYNQCKGKVQQLLFSIHTYWHMIQNFNHLWLGFISSLVLWFDCYRRYDFIIYIYCHWCVRECKSWIYLFLYKSLLYKHSAGAL